MVYLRFGDLPGGHEYGKCKMSIEHLKHLKAEAEFYLLPGLVKLCNEASDPYGKFGSIGDFNDEHYTDFSLKGRLQNTRYATTIDYTMEYKYRGNLVTCSFSMDSDRESTSINIYSISAKCNYLDNKSYTKSFRKLQKVISDGCISVASAMEKVETIEPEARLYMAFVTERMIDYYKENSSWDGEHGDCPLEFLFNDTTWGEFHFPEEN